MFLKRCFDILASSFGILFFFPIMIVTGIAIKLTSKGPIFFKQQRLTVGMKEFTIYKFRSMRTDFDKSGEGIQVKGSSNAITPIGKFIRKVKFDELPQLFNILKGDISFIGPRPELPRRLEYYSTEDKRIFTIPSGVSSPASIVFSDEEYLMEQVSDPEKFYIEQVMPYKIQLNLYYIDNRTFLYDLYLILATFLKIIGFLNVNSVVRDRELLRKKEEMVGKIGVEY